MIEPLVIDHDADVAQVTKEHERAELELLFFHWGFKRRPVETRWSTLKVNAYILKGPPNQT